MVDTRPLPLSQSLLSVMCSVGQEPCILEDMWWIQEAFTPITIFIKCDVLWRAGALYSGRHVVDTRPLPLSQSLLSVMCSGGQEPCILEDMWWIRGLYPYHNLY